MRGRRQREAHESAAWVKGIWGYSWLVIQKTCLQVTFPGSFWECLACSRLGLSTVSYLNNHVIIFCSYPFLGNLRQKVIHKFWNKTSTAGSDSPPVETEVNEVDVEHREDSKRDRSSHSICVWWFLGISGSALGLAWLLEAPSIRAGTWPVCHLSPCSGVQLCAPQHLSSRVYHGSCPSSGLVVPCFSHAFTLLNTMCATS